MALLGPLEVLGLPASLHQKHYFRFWSKALLTPFIKITKKKVKN